MDTTHQALNARARPERAADTELIDRLEAEWRVLVESRPFRNRLKVWGAEDSRLAFGSGDELVAAAQRRDVADWHERDRPLAALLERFGHDPLARRVALQVVLPGVKHLIDQIRGWDTEERAARVVAEAIDVMDRCSQTAAGSAPNFRVYMNTRRRVMKAAAKARSEPVSLSGDLSGLPDDRDPDGRGEITELRELIEWVQREGGLRSHVAREVVFTRTGQVDVNELAELLGVDPQTLRKRRQRAERQLTQALGVEQ